ncbi:MAG: exo-alpha-sialidase [Acidobacteria bacterium]|nr:MAG: exo-alpha-sialidase [Acidobacteriota bacterium]
MLLFISGSATAQIPLTQISNDTFTNTTSQHETEVEPASYSFGNTIVSVFQVGRFTDGGSSDIGFSTSTNGGTTWTHGNLPGITKIEGTGTYDRASDTSVIYNQKYKLWLAETLALSQTNGVHGAAVLVSSSTDGITWGNPVKVSVVETGGYYDKPWIGCDNTSTSPHYGNCYVEWDDFSQFDLIEMSTSTDGGKTWSAKKTTAASDSGNGGIPMVQPNGTVIVVVDDPFLASVLAFKSTDGGTTWSSAVTVAFINEHSVSGSMRALPLVNAQMDAAGKVYAVWADCSFRSGCSSNDIVYSTSTNGTTWSAVTRVPIDPTSSTVDHFTPGFAIKPGTSGSTAELVVTYNFFPKASCSACSLGVGIVTSTNGGTTWGVARTLAKGMNPSWLPSTTSGQMAGDYMTASFPGPRVHGVFSNATAPVGSTLHEAMDTNQFGIAEATADEPQFSSANDKPVADAHSQVHRTKPFKD